MAAAASLRIPPCDPGAGYRSLKFEIDQAVARVLESNRYILNSEGDCFEKAFAAYIGTRFAIGTGSGTDALQLCFRSCGIGVGDEVITVSHTAVATVAAIELAGAIPVLADIDPETYTIDVRQLSELITDKTKAIVPVHIYGHPAAMDDILSIAENSNLWIIEDCAQAHGASFDGKKIGSIGHIAAFSFYPTKNLGAMGDGGAVVTNDADLAEKARMIREYGWRERYISEITGFNTRLDEIQCAILAVKLSRLDELNDKRRKIAGFYASVLEENDLCLPISKENALHVYHQYVIRSPRRDELRKYLAFKGIGTLVHYPVPVHCQPAYAGRIRCHRFMNHTMEAAAQVISLPMYPELPEGDVEYIAECLNGWT